MMMKPIRVVLSVVFAAAWLMAGCGDDNVGTSSDVVVSAEPAGANCPDGGYAVDFGDGAQTYVCNGAGADAVLSVRPEPAGVNCPGGGVAIETEGGTSFVCAGEDGTDGTSVTVTAEVAGENCANGGFRLDSTSGTAFVCNGEAGTDGANGTSVTVQPERVGPNCPYGGYRLESASGTSYVCHGHPGVDGRCINDDNLGLDFYVDIPTLKGSVTEAGHAGTTRGYAVCYDVATAYDPDTGLPSGLPTHSPFRIVIPRDDMALPSLHQALTNSTAIDTITVEAWAPTPDGREALQHTWTLTQAYVVGLHQHHKVGQGHVVEVALTFESIAVAFLNGGFSTTASDPAFVLPRLRHDACEPLDDASTYVTITNPTIRGGVTQAGLENTIQVSSVCHGRVNPPPTSSGQPTAPREQTPVTLVKRFDRSSPLLLDALLNGTTLGTVQLDHWRTSGTSQKEQHLTVTLTNARVVRVEELDLAGGSMGSRWERVSLTYESITWDWKMDAPDLATHTATWN